MSELVDAAVFKTVAHEACRFKSDSGHFRFGGAGLVTVRGFPSIGPRVRFPFAPPFFETFHRFSKRICTYFAFGYFLNAQQRRIIFSQQVIPKLYIPPRGVSIIPLT